MMEQHSARGEDETAPNLITIAIDFGTTFSGAAWHWTGNPGIKEIILDRPNISGGYNSITDVKVATRIVYDHSGHPTAWGIQVNNDQKRYQEFKLSLGGTKSLPQTKLTAKFPDPLGLPLCYQFNASKLTIDYLRCLRQHVLAMIATKLSEYTVRNTQIQWILTIPAIWTEEQKASTKFCAEKGGMKGAIQLVTEPEAAVVHAIYSMKDSGLKVGNTFVVCDAGGGTVDLITYIIEGLDPLQIKELVRGNGDRCGGVFVDRAFAQYLEGKFSKCHGWSEEVLRSATQKFEAFAKRKFDDSRKSEILKVAGLIDDRHASIRKEKATVPSADICAVFEPTVNIIKRLVQEQVAAARATQHPVTAILLVGSFGQSPYLKQEIQATVGKLFNVLQVKDGQTAVVQGALIKALDSATPEQASMQITSRIARKFYGVSMGILFVANKHDATRRYWVDIEQKYFVQVAHWFMKKGASVPERGHQSFNYYEAWPVTTKAPTFYINILACDGPAEEGGNLPHYADPTLHLTRLEVNLSKIPAYDRKRAWNTNLQKWCFECELEVRVSYESAGLEYALWYRDACYGKVEARYD